MLEHFLSLDELSDLMQAEARKRALLDHLPLPVFLKDADLRYVAANPALARTLRAPLDRILGKNDADFFPAPVHERLHADDCNVLKSGITIEKEERFLCDGQWRTLRFRKAPLFTPQGVSGIVGVCWDWTELRQAEANAKQKQKMDAVAHLAGGIAHDFNNLLSVILGNVALARAIALHPDDPQTPLVPDLLNVAESASRHAAELTRQLLCFARRLDPQPEVVNFNELVQEIAAEDAQGLELKLAEGVWPVRADRGQLRQIVEQVLRFVREGLQSQGQPCLETANVALAGEPDVKRWSAGAAGTALLTVDHAEARPGEFVRLVFQVRPRVRIPEGLPLLFDPFTSPLYYHRGASLALALAHGLVKEQEGWLDCLGGADGGLSFAVFLPRCPFSLAAPDAAPHRKEGADSVLLIEDHDVVRHIGADLLQGLGYRVIGVSSAAAALDLLRAQPRSADLILLDLTLPGEDLDACAAELRRLAPHAPLLVCAAFPTGPVRRAVARLQAAGFVAKPFERGELAEALQAALHGVAADLASVAS
jgi:two-component system cell cycle sensor histidine kinase/response regulator CckA